MTKLSWSTFTAFPEYEALKTATTQSTGASHKFDTNTLRHSVLCLGAWALVPLTSPAKQIFKIVAWMTFPAWFGQEVLHGETKITAMLKAIKVK